MHAGVPVTHVPGASGQARSEVGVKPMGFDHEIYICIFNEYQTISECDGKILNQVAMLNTIQ